VSAKHIFKRTAVIDFHHSFHKNLKTRYKASTIEFSQERATNSPSLFDMFLADRLSNTLKMRGLESKKQRCHHKKPLVIGISYGNFAKLEF
jgi:hypothetical protein